MKTQEGKSLVAIGLMSGTSFDGIDAAVIKTDGIKIEFLGPVFSHSYEESFRDKIRTLISNNFDISLLTAVHYEIANLHANAVKTILLEYNIKSKDVDVIGFPGQTLYHSSSLGYTFQVGNPTLLSMLTNINVISDFRSLDLAHGGQGAPLVPLFHSALFCEAGKPLAVLNIGGVANITYLGENDEVIAFDCGPGCALIDDFMYSYNSSKFDLGGELASCGVPNDHMIIKFLENDYFKKPPPKSLDRNAFTSFLREVKQGLKPNDAAATLVKATAAVINNALKFLPQAPSTWIVCGGGRHNKFLMNMMRNQYGLNVVLVDELKMPIGKMEGDFIEAQAFGFLAVRSYYNMPLSLPTTTGVVKPMSGGAFYRF